MSSEVVLRVANEGDLPQVLGILALVVPLMTSAGNFQWDASYPNETKFREDVSRGVLWVAECGLEVVGFAALTTDQDEEYADCGWDITEPAIGMPTQC